MNRLMMRRPIRWLILAMLFLLALLSAIAHQQLQYGATKPPVPIACRRVVHAAGTACVPAQIKRLVTLDETSFEFAVALGLRPIGTGNTSKSNLYLQDQIATVETIGRAGEPSLERVLALKPDLILGLDYHDKIYAQTSQIAPTVLLTFEHSGQWKETFQRYGVALNREAIAQQVLEQYHQRLQDFQQRLKATLPVDQPPQISVVRIYPGSINLYLRDSFPGVILQDAALARPEPQNISAEAARELFNNEIQVSISLEQVDQADGDVMFIWTAENTLQANQTAKKKLVELESQPLWQHLQAVQNGQVHFVPDYWIGSGPLAANAIIDDLFKYLVKS